MKRIALQSRDGPPIYINADHIVMVRQLGGPYDETKILLVTGVDVVSRQPIDEVLELIDQSTPATSSVA